MNALDLLEDSQIVTENREASPPIIELTHERFRSVLCDHTELSLEATHAKLGETLERQQRYEIESVAGTLAHHFSMAKIPTKAFFYQLTSGRRLVKNSLYKRGVASLNRALSLEPEARSLMPLADVDRLTIKLQLSRAEALSAIGEMHDSEAAAHTALDLAERLQDIPLLSECHALIGHQYQIKRELERAENHLNKALMLANKIGHDKLRVMPTYRLGAIKWSQGEIEAPKKLWGESLSLARKIGDERAVGYGVNGLGLIAICEGRALEARRYIEQSTEIFERLGMLGPLSTTRVNLVELNMSIGILKKALNIADMTVSTAREVGHISGAGIGLAYRSDVLLAIGRLTEAQSNCTEAISIAESVSNREDFVKATVLSLEINLTMGAPEAAKATYLAHQTEISSYKGEGLDDRALVYYAHSLALTGEKTLAHSILNDTRKTAPSWPHVQIRNQIARGKARLALEQPELAVANFQYALKEATTCQFRYWQLVSHHYLYTCVTEPTIKKKHRHVLNALVRSLAAGLSKDTSAQFLERWDKH
jgi:tetratricopeptide (TPR) repeat protein